LISDYLLINIWPAIIKKPLTRYGTSHTISAIQSDKGVMKMADETQDLKGVLEDLIRQRDELNVAIKVLQGRMGGAGSAIDPANKPIGENTPSGEVSDPLSVVYAGLFFGKTQTQAVKAFLERVRRPVKTPLLVEGLKKGGCTVGGSMPARNLWGVLNRFPDTFVLVPRAGWGLVEWYELAVLAKMRRDKSEENGEEKKEE
jgi:hypothetical protein